MFEKIILNVVRVLSRLDYNIFIGGEFVFINLSGGYKSVL